LRVDRFAGERGFGGARAARRRRDGAENDRRLSADAVRPEIERALSRCRTKNATRLRLVYFQAAATASRHGHCHVGSV
jgi:hypothetical protein